MTSSDGLTQEQRFQLKLHEIDSRSNNLGLVIKSITILLIAWQLRIAFIALAGTTTTFIFKFLANLTVSQTVSWSACVSGLGYGYVQKRLYNRNSRKSKERIDELELLLKRRGW